MHRLMPTLAIVALLAEPGAKAQGTGEPPTTLYRLSGPSSYLSGCIEGPCTCPIQLKYMGGTFGVTPAGPVDGGQLYTLSAIEWFTHFNGSVLDEITGSGSYTVGEELHRITLELQVNGGSPIEIDSGFVPNGESFPRIDIAGLTDGFCFQDGVDIEAAPSAYRIDVAMPTRFDLLGSVPDVPATYDVVGGDLGLLSGSGGSFVESSVACLGDEMAAPSMQVTEPLAPGEARWFLIGGTPGPGYDSGGAGQLRPRDAGLAAAPYGCP